MGWRQLNNALKPAWIQDFKFFTLNLFPGLFPGLAFATPLFEHMVYPSNTSHTTSATSPQPNNAAKLIPSRGALGSGADNFSL